jgi:cyclophilin family peptidyl-prolyl cis-trans isomerase/HEAT repeat protein
MRKLAPVLLIALACTTTTAPPPATESSATPAAPYGMTVAEEARILALEDRREYDATVVAAWVKHPNVLHRRRIAMALARIGPHDFVDANNNGVLDEPAEKHAGVSELAVLATDTDRSVREAAAFALGEIGDRNGIEPLFNLTTDADFGVATEAVEALSKLAADPQFGNSNLTRYLWMTDAKWPEGLRARAVRFLFRFEHDRADAAAQHSLASPSEAVRQEAAYSLSRRAYAPARGQLELLLNDPNYLTRAYASAALGRIGDATPVPLLIEKLGDEHPWVRTNAAVALTRILPSHLEALSTAHIPRLLALSEDSDPGVRVAAIDLLGVYVNTEPVAVGGRLMNMLKNGTQAERELAAGVIVRQYLPTSAQAREANESVSPWAIVRMIERTAGVEYGPALRARYATHPDPIVRTAVMNNIPDTLIESSLDTIRAGMADADVMVRATALEKFGKVTSLRVSEWATTLEAAEVKERGNPMNDARIAAIRALAERQRPQNGAYLRALLADSDPVVRRVAADLLVEKLDAKRPRYTPLAVTRPQSDYEQIVRWSRTPHTATIHMTRGKIELALLPMDAPMTAWNFAQLAQKKFFDNTSFMRVVPNFVIQGGDPRNDMNGGPGYAIRDEINLQKYTRGAVGMALSGPDTGGSQFFITHSPQPHLDGGYTIFGRVYEGMNAVVDQTERGDRVQTITIDEHPPVSGEQLAQP